MECESKICTLWSPKSNRKSARFCVTVLSNNSPSVSAVSKIWENNAQILYKAHFWCRRLDIKHPTKNLMYHSFLLKKKGKLHHLSVSFQANFELFLKGFGATNWFKYMQRELRRSYDRMEVLWCAVSGHKQNPFDASVWFSL